MQTFNWKADYLNSMDASTNNQISIDEIIVSVYFNILKYDISAIIHAAMLQFNGIQFEISFAENGH